MLITVQPDPSWQLSLAQLSPSLFCIFIRLYWVLDTRTKIIQMLLEGQYKR